MYIFPLEILIDKCPTTSLLSVIVYIGSVGRLDDERASIRTCIVGYRISYVTDFQCGLVSCWNCSFILCLFGATDLFYRCFLICGSVGGFLVTWDMGILYTVASCLHALI